MEDVFKKVLYAGAGLAALATEKVQKTVDELVEKGKISDVEGKKILDDFFKNTEAKKDEFEEKLKNVTEEVVSRFDFIRKNKSVAEVIERLERIEEQLNIQNEPKSSTKKEAPKTASKKESANA